MKEDKVDMALVERYVRGELGPRDMHALERRAQDNPMLMDIILGMEQKTQAEHTANISDIRKRIAEYTRHHRTRRLSTAQRWAIAASTLMAVTIGALWFVQRDPAGPDQSAVASATHIGESRQSLPAAPADQETATPEHTAPVPSTSRAGAAAKARTIPSSPPANENTGTKSNVNTDAAIKKEALAAYRSRADVSHPVESELAPPVEKAAKIMDGSDSMAVTLKRQPAVALQKAEAAGETGKRPDSIAARPETGWTAYRQYLRQGTEETRGAGVITLSFTIDEQGTPTNIRVVRTTDPALNNQAIRLVQQGARWKLGADGKRDVELQIDF